MTRSDDRDPVDVLAEEFAERLRRGERPSVGAYADAHPDHAEQLRELLPAVAQMEQLKQFRKPSVVGRPSLPDRLGDYRIVRELGRGGMGIVFEAVQESLGRRVALKVLATHAPLDTDRRERFVREAKAAARLHHTNIVPVFGVGEQDGLPYYVMQLIPGHGLNTVVAGWRGARGEAETPLAEAEAPTVLLDPGGTPTPPGRSSGDRPAAPPADLPPPGDWRFVAEVGAQVADALQYAHETGVLHRDVKPANLLLDGRGQVWVADFGLAKLDDQHGLTATGHILGTLQYLAPECLHGDADPRSDVYGLGATLYELLTLEPPFAADTPARLMRQLADTDPRPPRAVNPDVPRDLETIVLTALAREPGRRYATAGELADDLRAFLDDRPIRARRVTWLDRGRRWCRRNPVVAALSFTTVAALVLAAVVGWVGFARARVASEVADRKREEAEDVSRQLDLKRAEAVEASQKLEANLKLSLEAFEQVFKAAVGTDERPVGMGPRPGGGRPGGGGPGGGGGGPQGGGPPVEDTTSRAAVLEAVLEFYDKFAEQNATNPRLRLEAAKARRRVGEMRLWLGQENADAPFRRANALLDGVEAAGPESGVSPADVRFERMLVLANAPAGVWGTAEEQLKRAAEIGREFTDPARADRVRAVGTVYLRLGEVREQARNPAAEESYRKAIELLGRRQPDWPPHAQIELFFARKHLADLLVARREWQEARRLLEAATAQWREKSMGGPQSGGFPREPVAAAYRQLAGVFDQLGDRPAADRARDDADKLSGNNPFPSPGGGFQPKGPRDQSKGPGDGPPGDAPPPRPVPPKEPKEPREPAPKR